MSNHDEQTREDARNAYAHHQIRESAPGRWLLMRRSPDGTWSSSFLVSILVDLGRVILHGDGPLAYLAGYSGEGGPEGCVRWVARCRGDMRYLADKAAREGRQFGYETDKGEAVTDILRRLCDDIGEETVDALDGLESDWLSAGDVFDDEAPELTVPGDPKTDALVRWLLAFAGAVLREPRSTRERMRWGCVEDAAEQIEFYDDVAGARQALYNGGWDCERVGSIGEVVAPRVYYAQAACARLVELWDAAQASNKENESCV